MKKLFFALFNRRALRAYAWILVTVLTVVLLLRQYVGWCGTKRWVAVQAELAREGESIDFRKVTPEPVPDDRNFCAIPLLKGLAATSDVTDDKSEAGLNRRRLLDAALPKNDNAGLRPGFSQGAALGKSMDLRAWADWLRKEGSLAMPADSGEPAKDILTALAKHDALIHELAAGLDRPDAQWTPAWKTRSLPENLFEVSLPHYSIIQALTQMLCFRSMVAARAGDAAKAHEALLIATRISQAAMQEPFLIGLLLASANTQSINAAVWEICDARAGTVEDFSRLQQALAQMNFRQSALLAWRSELAASSSALAYLTHTRDSKMLAMVSGLDGSYKFPVEGAIFIHLAPDGWFDANAATIAQWNFEYSIKPLRDFGFKEMMSRQNELTKMIVEHKADLARHSDEFLAMLLTSATSSISMSVVYAQSTIDQAAAACALERYRIEQGKYPDTLTEAYQGEKIMPQDVLSGAPMGYRKTTEGRYTLWNVGFDGKDDGGKRVLDEKKPENTKFRNVKYVGDWVWDYPAP